jgi:tetratricopeptide (TPR) repeat protein
MHQGKETSLEPEETAASSVPGVEVPCQSIADQQRPSGEAADAAPSTPAHKIERAEESAEPAVKAEPAPASETKSIEGADADQSKSSTSEKNWLQKFADNAKALFTVLSSSFLFVLFVALIICLAIELTRSTVFLDLSEVPKELRDNGLSAIAVSQELADELAEIQRISLSKNTQRLLEPAWAQPDIQVPGSNISFRSVSQWLKQRLGNPITNNDIHLTGELTKDGEYYRLIVRRSDESVNQNFSMTVQDKVIANVLKLGANAVAKLVDPVTLASYYFFVEDRNDQYVKTIETIKRVIGSGNDKQKARAYNVWGNVMVDQDDAKHAIYMYENATRHDTSLGEAYVNWGSALLFDLNDPINAISRFKAAIDTNRQLSSAYNGLALALDRIEKPNEALSEFQRAIETADSNDVWPYVNKGDLVSSLGRREEALALYQKAKELAEEKIYRDETQQGSRTGTLSHYSDSYEALCEILTSTGDFSNAIKSGEAAVSIDATSPEAHRFLGVALQYSRAARGISAAFETNA